MTTAPFAGKWALTTSKGTAVTLLDAASGALGLSPVCTPPLPEQRFNAYGDPDSGVALQAGNGRFLADTGDGWAATATVTAPQATFTLNPVPGDHCRVMQTNSQGKFWLSAEGSVLRRVPVSGSAPDSTVFTRVVVTGSLADLLRRGGSGEDLRWVTFTGADLSNIQLSGCDLSNATLSGACVRNATLQACKLDHADFSGLDLDGVVAVAGAGDQPDFSHTKLHSSTVLQGVEFTEATFENATSSGTGRGTGPVFSGMTARQTNFSGANLTGVVAPGSTLTGADFTDADLSRGDFAGADFTSAVMDRVVLTEAALSRAIFNDAQLVGADFGLAQVTDCSFERANLTNAQLSRVKPGVGRLDFTGAVLVATVLSGLDLRKAVFDKNTVLTQTQLDGTDLTGQVLDEVDFFFANLRNANLNMVSAIRTNFAEADLTGISALAGGQGVSFVGSNLSNAKLAGAKLKGARFGAGKDAPAAVLSNAFMPDADLTSANLFSVDMSGVQWYGLNAKGGADLQNANLCKANLATMDLSQASMKGADLSFANLVNTNLSGVALEPTGENRSASLAFASLQGTNLTEASLVGANLTNAAIALDIEGACSQFVGVPLFTIPNSLVGDLDHKRLSDGVKSAFSDAGYPLVGAAVITVAGAEKQWSIDNYDKSGRSGLQSGYGSFFLVLRAKSDAIRVYGGSPLLVVAIDEKNKQLQQAPSFKETAGLLTAMKPDTVCPSGMKWSMRSRGFDVETLMTAALPPAPPRCVPTPTQWCINPV